MTYNAKPSAATAVETWNCSITNGIAGAYADDPIYIVKVRILQVYGQYLAVQDIALKHIPDQATNERLGPRSPILRICRII